MGLVESSRSDRPENSSKDPEINRMIRDKALTIGINYTGSRNELRGCVNDSKNIRKLLIDLGYPEQRILSLNDQDYPPESPNYPTRENILRALYWLTTDSSVEEYTSSPDIYLIESKLPFDHRCFLHYSGHGSQSSTTNAKEHDGHDETIMPVDFEVSGSITDDLLYRVLNRLEKGCGLQALMDCCCSGTNLDLPYVYQSGKVRHDSGSYETNAEFQQFSAVMDDQFAIDLASSGAMTTAFIEVIEKQGNEGKVDELVKKMNKVVRRLVGKGKHQVCYSSGKYFRVGDKIKL